MTEKAEQWFRFTFGFGMNCVYTVAPILYTYASFTGNTWTKFGQPVVPTASCRVWGALFGLGLEAAVLVYWRKWWQENWPPYRRDS